MPRKFPKSLAQVEILPGVRVGIVLRGLPAITLIGTLIAELEERHRDIPVIHLPIKVHVEKEVDLEPEFLLVQLTTAVTIGTVEDALRAPLIVFPAGTIVAVNLDDILIIGPQ
ncbi:MAG: hypothetical protein P4N41_26065 [Negativicutes bacterium]|nr:hypothetical protein [Negativicutes bacterium]